jgi:hypothetical protein
MHQVRIARYGLAFKGDSQSGNAVDYGSILKQNGPRSHGRQSHGFHMADSTNFVLSKCSVVGARRSIKKWIMYLLDAIGQT